MRTRSSPRRGEATRAALIQAAIDIFGRDGYTAATTKAIACEAGANQALISYYFGGKEGLYVAAVEHIAGEMARRMGPVVERAEAARSGLDAVAPAGRSLARGYFVMLCNVINGFVDVLTDPESAAWAKIIIREQQEPSPAFATLYSRVQGRLLNQMAILVARINGRAAPAACDRLNVLLAVGQALVFRTGRAAVLEFMGWEDIRGRDVTRIKKALRRSLAATLGVTDE